jgi:hypothetical protein
MEDFMKNFMLKMMLNLMTLILNNLMKLVNLYNIKIFIIEFLKKLLEKNQMNQILLDKFKNSNLFGLILMLK